MPSTPAGTPLTGKTVLQVLPALEAGGVERGTLEIAAALREAGARALVVSSGGRMAAGLGADHIPLPVHTKNPLGLWRNAAGLKALIEREGVDLVHARSRAPAWSARSAARRAGVPFVTTFHGAYGAGSAAKRAWNRIMVRGDLVIAVSDFIAAHIQETYRCPPSRIRVVHRGIDAAAFDPGTVQPREKAALRAAWGVPEGARAAAAGAAHPAQGPRRADRGDAAACRPEARRRVRGLGPGPRWLPAGIGGPGARPSGALRRTYRRCGDRLCGERCRGLRFRPAGIFRPRPGRGRRHGPPRRCQRPRRRARNRPPRRDRLAGSARRPGRTRRRHSHCARRRRTCPCGKGARACARPLHPRGHVCEDACGVWELL